MKLIKQIHKLKQYAHFKDTLWKYVLLSERKKIFRSKISRLTILKNPYQNGCTRQIQYSLDDVVFPENCELRLGRTGDGRARNEGRKAGPPGGFLPATTPDHTDGPENIPLRFK